MPGWLQTVTPRSFAASRSTMSVPMEQVAMSRRSRSCSSASLYHFTAPRVFMITPAPSTRASCSSRLAGRSVNTATSP